jgi:hypothetical protein
MTWRPTPTVEAFGRVVIGGTRTFRELVACETHAKRQPASSSSCLKARESRFVIGTFPSRIWILHFLQVPFPPHVESIAKPFQLAASKTETPDGTRTDLSLGSKLMSTRANGEPISALSDSTSSEPNGVKEFFTRATYLIRVLLTHDDTINWPWQFWPGARQSNWRPIRHYLSSDLLP